MAYRFIDDDKDFFGVRWLLHRLDIYPNAYYNDRKHRKAAYREEKQRIKKSRLKRSIISTMALMVTV